jgi:hypothetical protein
MVNKITEQTNEKAWNESLADASKRIFQRELKGGKLK